MPNQERLRETKHHGAVRFPFNIYPCTIPGDFLQVPLHWHDSMELVYVKKGSGIVQVGVNAYPAEQGEIYIFAPGTLHALHQRGQAVMEYENIILSWSRWVVRMICAPSATFCRCKAAAWLCSRASSPARRATPRRRPACRKRRKPTR
ncbi:MAG: cupin domain-containing protein [Subdoligranulum sp.]